MIGQNICVLLCFFVGKYAEEESKAWLPVAASSRSARACVSRGAGGGRDRSTGTVASEDRLRLRVRNEAPAVLDAGTAWSNFRYQQSRHSSLRDSRRYFAYDNGNRTLNDLNLRVEPGQLGALVGPTGAGKTTIASLIGRFYDPTRGVVMIDGHDVRSYKLKSLRRQMSFVLQETLLFRATVWQNIA